MGTLTPNEIIPAGKTATYTAAGAQGDLFTCGSDERTFLHVKNGGGSAITVSILPAQATEKVEGVGTVAVPSMGGSVGAAGDAFFGPIPADYIGPAGQAQVTYSAVTTVTAAVYHMSKVD